LTNAHGSSFLQNNNASGQEERQQFEYITETTSETVFKALVVALEQCMDSADVVLSKMKYLIGTKGRASSDKLEHELSTCEEEVCHLMGRYVQLLISN